jgi:hypothetical protein
MLLPVVGLDLAVELVSAVGLDWAVGLLWAVVLPWATALEIEEMKRAAVQRTTVNVFRILHVLFTLGNLPQIAGIIPAASLRSDFRKERRPGWCQ